MHRLAQCCVARIKRVLCGDVALNSVAVVLNTAHAPCLKRDTHVQSDVWSPRATLHCPISSAFFYAFMFMFLHASF
eukprot:m.355938 g.355938  ORF g.355938 m.355938 type:complete len:76 (+) comp17389_c0_seq1:418-645(+)